MMLRLDLPSEGSGAKGNLIKEDYCRVVLTYLMLVGINKLCF